MNEQTSPQDHDQRPKDLDTEQQIEDDYESSGDGVRRDMLED